MQKPGMARAGIGPCSSSSLATPIMGSEFEGLIRSLQDSNQRDDLKLKAVQEIWVGLDVFTSSTTYSSLLESLIKVFIKLLNETQPQFIAENNTHQLRKQILEIILRTSTHEALKSQVKDITKTLLRLITVDNEENAILAIKIVMDVGKSSKMQFIPEVQTVVTFCRDIVKNMLTHMHSGMFDLHDLGVAGRPPRQLHHRVQQQYSQPEEGFIESVLPTCYCVQPVTLPNKTSSTGEPIKYNLIPRSGQSVKIIQELTMFFVHLYQHFKNNILSECLDFLLMCIHFASLVVPIEAKESQLFNKALADDFYTSQTKSLTFVSIMGKVPQFMEVIQQHSNILITGMLCLLENLPSDLVIVRKDVLMTLKFCFSSDLRNKFIPLLPRLLSEEALLGTGFTSVDHLRVFMYQMLADLLHHMRNNLGFPMLAHTAAVFGRTMNDNSIMPQVQVMCVRLLSSVCETMTKHEQQGEATRDVLMNILENLVIKLKRISVYHLPLLYKTHGADMENKPFDRRDAPPVNLEEKDESCPVGLDDVSWSRRCSLDTVAELENVDGDKNQMEVDSAPLLPPPNRTGKQSTPEQILSNLWTINNPTLTVQEARNMVKYVMQTCKFCASQIGSTRRSNVSIPKVKERDIFERLLKYGVQCMDVFVLPYQQPHPRSSAASRSKDEKEALESFAALFTTIDSDVFRELFAKYIDFLVERIHFNVSLQLIVNAFLVRADWSCKFGSIMLKYLMDKMPCLSVSNEKTVLYVKLFKIIFSAIGCSQPQSSPDGELMLKPYLPDLIRKSTEYALTAREPLNYFLLLRALFRSIGGGAHDILYGQFLPLLPNLLQFLNKLQSCPHRQQMRELFLELCLTVPVRLSSLLPYLPLLMDPLVCALNGSTALVQQGLRTLELCVDNLQPEYLFEHMAPVRGALIQGLWKVLGTSADPNSAAIAFRILGKFGGANRRMLSEPQQLQSIPDVDVMKCSLMANFDVADGMEEQMPVVGEILITDIMTVAVEQMRLCTPQPEPNAVVSGSLLPAQFVNQSSQPHAILLRQNCVELAQAVILTSLAPMAAGEDWKQSFIDSLKEQFRKLEDIPEGVIMFKCPREGDRKMFIDALVVLFIGVVGKDLRNQYLKFFNAVVRQLTIHGLLECAGHDVLSNANHGLVLCLDGSTLVDALVTVLSDSNKDFLHSAVVALCHINDTCRTVLPRIELMSRVPMVRYLLEQVMSLCYGPSWFSRLGGASALNYIIDNYPTSLIRDNLSSLIESLCEVIVGLVDEISSGAVDMAVGSLQLLAKKVLTIVNAGDKLVVLSIFVRHYTLLMFHGNDSVREKAWLLLNTLSTDFVVPIDEILGTHTQYLQKRMERIIRELGKMSMCDQSAALSCLASLIHASPQLIDFDEKNEVWLQQMNILFDMCETSAADLLARDMYKMSDACPGHFLPPYPIVHQMDCMRANAIRAVIGIYHMMVTRNAATTSDSNTSEVSSRMMKIALSSLLAGTTVVAKAAEQALLTCAPIPLPIVQSASEDILTRLRDSQESLAEDVTKLYQLVQLNHALFSKELAASLVKQISLWFGDNDMTEQLQTRSIEDIDAVHVILRMFLLCNVTDSSLITPLFSFAAFFESEYCIDAPLTWLPMLCELLSRNPVQSLVHLLSDEFLSTYGRASFLRRTMKHEKSAALRDLLRADPVYFERLLQHQYMKKTEKGEWCSFSDHDTESVMQREETTMQLLDTVARTELAWFGQQDSLVAALRRIWNSAEFKMRYNVRQMHLEDGERHQIKVQAVTGPKYKVPRLFVNCFIRYLRKNRDCFDLLFDVLFVFDNNYATDFGFVKDFLEKEVLPCYSLAWRRDVFQLVLEKFEREPAVWQKNTTMARIVQYLLIPCLHWAFERYNVDEILGPALSPTEQEDDPNSIVSRLARVLEQHRTAMGDKNVIVFYQLCTLLVEHAPLHIHDNACKKQGGRLRIFMLFAWPCLTLNSHSDPTLRFTGFLFLAHIIDRFTINRKIVLQVFHCLASSYQLDNRDQLKRAIDVLTPAVPVRMEDGHQQMLNEIKKILLEESHNIHQIQHVVQMVVRNYRVYFYVRHELIPPLLQAITRTLNTPNGLSEGLTARRLAVDVCEMTIKWDLLRNQKAEQNAKSEEPMEVENVLEALKATEKEEKDKDGSQQSSSSSSPAGANAGPSAAASSSTSSSSKAAEQPTTSAQSIMKEKGDLVMKPIAKEYVDQVVSTLLKFACALPTPTQPPQFINSTTEMAKKSLGLLRAALKPVVWGETATIKLHWIEKQLNITPDIISQRQEPSSHASQVLQQAQQTLDVILTLTCVMPKSLLLQVVRPIQRPIITCLNSGYNSLVRTVNYLVGSLFEKTRSSDTGVDELDILNQYMTKYLNDQFNGYHRSQNAVVQQVFTAFSLLRAICGHQPGYLDSMCLQAFIKVLEKAVREHVAHVASGLDTNREKSVAELISIALELIRPRVEAIGVESRRAICQNILLPLIEKTNYEKVIENLLKITHELVRTHKDENSANIGLPLAVRLHSLMDRRVRSSSSHQNGHLMSLYLNLVMDIFDNPLYCQSEYAERMEHAFYWGLVTPDPVLRDKFLAVWERRVEPFIMRRLSFIMTKQDWTGFRDYYWLRHALWLCLRCIPQLKSESEVKRVFFSDAATLWRTLECVISMRDLIPSLGAINMANSGPSSRSTPSATPEGESMTEEDSRVTTLLLEQRSLLSQAASFDISTAVDAFKGIIFNVQDTKFVSAMWKRLFISLISSVSHNERTQIANDCVPFIASGSHNAQTTSQNSVLASWLEIVYAINPLVVMPPRLIQFIAVRHHAWYMGAILLENRLLQMNTRMLNNDALLQYHMDPTTRKQMEVMDYLADLYRELDEMDQFAAVWDRRAWKPETVAIMAKMQIGDILEANRLVEEVMMATGETLSMPIVEARFMPPIMDELQMLFNVYTTCCQELMQWEKLRDFANSKEVQSPRHLMLAGLHLPDWAMVKECKDQLSGCIPPNFLNQYNIYNAMLSVMQPTDPLSDPLAVASKARMERCIDEAVQSHIAHWRTLPRLVGNAHIKVLQAMNMIREVADCVDLQVALESSSGPAYNSNFTNEMKTVIKIWRNRGPAVSDELSFVAGVYNWRCQVHAMVIKRFEELEKSAVPMPAGTNTQSILPIHSAAQGHLIISKTARNMRLFDLAIEQLNKLHTMITVPMMDAHQKVCEQAKVLRAQASQIGTSQQERTTLLSLALKLFDETNIGDFHRDQICKFFSIKGSLLSSLNQREAALKAFSAAGQTYDSPSFQTNNSSNVFKAWGNHMDRLFHNDKSDMAGITSGCGAIACFLEAARSEAEPKARKYIAKFLWTAKHMVACGPTSCNRLDEQIVKHERTTVAYNWLTWLPQMINDVRFRPQSKIVLIMQRIATVYPLQVFYALRAVFPTSLIEGIVEEVCLGGPTVETVETMVPWIVSLLPVLRLSCQTRSSDIRMFHRLLCAMDEMREFWAERQFRWSNHMKNEVFRCLHDKHRLPLETVQLDGKACKVLEEWKKEVALGDEVAHLMRENEVDYAMDEQRPQTTEEEFKRELTASITELLSAPPAAGQLLRFMESVLKINHRLNKRVTRLPRRVPMQSTSEFLFSFTHRQGCVEMPSDMLNVLKTGQYVSMISRLEPNVEISIEGGELVRKLRIRAQTGKACTYYLRRAMLKSKFASVNRCQQYLSSLNSLLLKERETCRRHLSVYTPTQLRVGEQSSLIETVGVVANCADAPPSSSSTMIHPMEVLSRALLPVGMRPDDVVAMFYDRILAEEMPMFESRYRVFGELTVDEFVSPSILFRYMMEHYPDITQFYVLRKQFARHLSVMCMVEWVTRLSPVGLSDLYLNKSTGQLCNPDYTFQVQGRDDMPVPFRLTPNMVILLGFTLQGDVQWSSMAVSRCLFNRHPEVMLRPLLWDDVADTCTGTAKELWSIAEGCMKQIATSTTRLRFADGVTNPQDVAGLLRAARQVENLCRMNPALHPWF